MNYTLLAYVVSIILLLWIAIHPASHVVVLRIDLRYWAHHSRRPYTGRVGWYYWKEGV